MLLASGNPTAIRQSFLAASTLWPYLLLSFFCMSAWTYASGGDTRPVEVRIIDSDGRPVRNAFVSIGSNQSCTTGDTGMCSFDDHVPTTLEIDAPWVSDSLTMQRGAGQTSGRINPVRLRLQPSNAAPLLLPTSSATPGTDSLEAVPATSTPFIAVAASQQPAPEVYQPLTTFQKFTRFARNSYSPRIFITGALTAGMPNIGSKPVEPTEPGTNSTDEQWQAYDTAMRSYQDQWDTYRRVTQEEIRSRERAFITGVAEAETRNLLGNFVLPAALGQDPRYFRCDCSGFTARLVHASNSIFITRNSSGRYVPNYSRLGATVGAALMARYAYAPALPAPQLATSKHMRKSIGFNLAFDAISNILHEFWLRPK